jgi:sugar phosphate isomerase/epimerase
MKSSIELASLLGAKKYSFHAGFLIDPKVNELGKRIPSKKLFSRDASLEVFVKRVAELSNFAGNFGISLMIENNVLSQKNWLEFKDNPFLMADPKECEQIFKYLPENVGLLLDVAHLKVSANTLNFEPQTFFELMDKKITGYHLSDNNGLADTNQKFDNASWFWPFIKKDINYYTIEVYNEDYKTLKGLVDLTSQKIFN